MMVASYEHGVDWVAAYILPTTHNRATMAAQPCVALLAELFDMTPEDVAGDVVTARQHIEKENRKDEYRVRTTWARLIRA